MILYLFTLSLSFEYVYNDGKNFLGRQFWGYAQLFA